MISKYSSINLGKCAYVDFSIWIGNKVLHTLYRINIIKKLMQYGKLPLMKLISINYLYITGSNTHWTWVSYFHGIYSGFYSIIHSFALSGLIDMLYFIDFLFRVNDIQSYLRPHCINGKLCWEWWKKRRKM